MARSTGRILVIALVLVGIPLGVLVVGRESAHPAAASQRVVVERQIKAELEREGVETRAVRVDR